MKLVPPLFLAGILAMPIMSIASIPAIAATVRGYMITTTRMQTSSPAARKRWTIHRVLDVGSVVTVIGAVLLVPGSRPVLAAGSTALARCSAVQLQIEPLNQGLGAALGHTGLWFRIHVQGGGSCTLHGFPRVRLLDRHFRPLPRRVGHGGYIIPPVLPRPLVVLDKQHDAYFALEYGVVPGGNRPCRHISYLQVTPPGDVRSVVTHASIFLCPGPVDVSPIESTHSLP